MKILKEKILRAALIFFVCLLLGGCKGVSQGEKVSGGAESKETPSEAKCVDIDVDCSAIPCCERLICDSTTSKCRLKSEEEMLVPECAQLDQHCDDSTRCCEGLVCDSTTSICKIETVALQQIAPQQQTTTIFQQPLATRELIARTINLPLLWKKVSAGWERTCAIDINDKLFCWGYNGGLLGTGDTENKLCPQKIGDSNWEEISVGDAHTCAIGKDYGTLYCWGGNYYGELGDGTQNNKSSMDWSLGQDWTSVTAGGAHTCGIQNGNLRYEPGLYCWGWNQDGQLGTASYIDEKTPRHIGSSTDWESVTAGEMHTCGKKTNGLIYCWGRNNEGECGYEGSHNTPYQVKVNDVAYYVYMLEAGYYHTCAIDLYGSSVGRCWGTDDKGQLGIGYILEDKYSPTKLYDDLVLTQISAGGFHTCGIFKITLAENTEGKLYCWGWNYFGQSGISPMADEYILVPTQIGSNDWIYVSAGSNHTCAIKTDNTLWCWGKNASGQLGDGTTIDKSSPTMVILKQMQLGEREFLRITSYESRVTRH